MSKQGYLMEKITEHDLDVLAARAHGVDIETVRQMNIRFYIQDGIGGCAYKTDDGIIKWKPFPLD